jgi:hypothetical protein
VSKPAAPATGVTYRADDLLARYEELRRAALGDQGAGLGVGLGVLVRRGMAAWMVACSSPGGQAASATGARSTLGAGMPQAVQAEIVVLLAGMALGSMQEVTA